MKGTHVSQRIGVLAGIALCVAFVGVDAAQKVTPAELATRISGTWRVNRDKSQINQNQRGGGGAAGRRGGGASFMVAGVPGMSFQRGGGGGGASMDEMSPSERAAVMAIRTFRSAPDPIMITATADSVTMKDSRGERAYPANDKTVKIDVDGASINSKTKWENAALKQEFSTTAEKVTYLWEPSADGKEMVFSFKVENSGGTSNSPKIYYDRQAE